MALFFVFFTAVIAHMLASSNGQVVSLMPPLEQGDFYCDQDRITCIGTGGVISWTAPPSIPENNPRGFSSSSSLQTPVSFGNVEITLTNIVPGTPPNLTSVMTLSNISEVNVTCQTEVSGSLQALNLIRSITPSAASNLQVLHISCTSFRITWTAATENYDLMHYVAQVYVDDSATQYNTTNTSMDLDLPLSGGERIRVTVAVVTRCGQVSMPINSDVIVFVYTSVCENLCRPCDNRGLIASVIIGGVSLLLLVGTWTSILVILWRKWQCRKKSVHQSQSEPK
ncbi:uncharacterized protein LOC135347011 isoform X2 [Halichondria panicea]|uniref:uncharacterized protein LOC135347011 isoform X2 n=1 Tax=Halichondria panicea TaxID=6063 RepID=UPI00312BA683